MSPSNVSFPFRVLPSLLCNYVFPVVAAVTPVFQRARLCSFCEIYERAGVGGGCGVRKRGPSVFITPLRRM